MLEQMTPQEKDALIQRLMECCRMFVRAADSGIRAGEISGGARDAMRRAMAYQANAAAPEIVADTVIRLDRWDRVIKAAQAWDRARLMGDVATAEEALANAVAILAKPVR